MNADSQVVTGSDLTGINMFAYCGNNPVNNIDPTGHAWGHWIFAAAVVLVCAVAVVVTAGGAVPALLAVAAVANGCAAATVASTIWAGAFIGSSMVLGAMVLNAAETSSSPQEFAKQGNWGTISATIVGGVMGGGSAYVSTKSSSLSSSKSSPAKTTSTPKADARNTPDQQAVLSLAKDAKRTGISMSNAKTLVGWGKEYGVNNSRIDISQLQGNNPVTQGPHAHIGSVNHIQIFPD